MLSDLKGEAQNIFGKIAEIEKHLDLDSLKKKASALEETTYASDFWNDHVAAQKTMQELKNLKNQVSSIEGLKNSCSDILMLVDMAVSENDTQSEEQIAKDLEKLKSDLSKMELSTLLGGEHDGSDSILSINAGAGGTDAQDWAEILLRMYTRWAESKGYSIEIADMSYGEQAGIKSAVLFIKGLYSYGYLKSETGIHRLVRMSPFNSDGKRHTSFAAVEVIPEIGQELAVEIKPEDLKVDTYRASGPGGQNVNKTSSAVRITHMPTGLVSQSQASPSQHRNREIAMTLLVARLKGLLEQEQKEKIDELRGEQKQIAWGSQIRSYVFAPYQLVKDHRTGAETGNVQKVIDGDIDIFIEAFLKAKK